MESVEAATLGAAGLKLAPSEAVAASQKQLKRVVVLMRLLFEPGKTAAQHMSDQGIPGSKRTRWQCEFNA